MGHRSIPLLALGVLLAAAAPASAQPAVTSGGLPEAHTCEACHGSHVPDRGEYSLRLGDAGVRGSWVRGTGPGAVSQSCLRCHSTPADRMNAGADAKTGPIRLAEGKYLGLDLADDHTLGRLDRNRDDRGLLFDTNPRNLRTRRSLTGRASILPSAMGSVECTTCHDPHRPIGPIPTPEEEPILCGACHDAGTYGYGLHVSATCSDCHRLHEGRGLDLLREEDEELLCMSCHGGARPPSGLDRARRTSLPVGPPGHVVPPAGRCSDCHPAHGTVTP